LKSETFNTLSARSTGTVTASGIKDAQASGPNTEATITYDAVSNTYLLSSPHASASGQTPDAVTADIVLPDMTQASSTPCASATCAGSAYISRLGASGSSSIGFTYTYVSYANWHSEAAVGADTARTMNVAVFGATTPANAIPTFGTATYALDVNGDQMTGPLGTSGGRQLLTSFSGNGTATFDFGSGSYLMAGTVNSVPNYPNSVSFSSSGKLSSGANGYSGTFSFNDAAAFNGTLGGWFFGPAAQELGAVFSAKASDGRVAVGTIMGHK
jgi:hypothetical protein